MIYYDQSGVLVRTSTNEDVEYLAGRLRKSDVQEIYASDHLESFRALHLSLTGSVVCLSIVYSGEPVGMFGINAENLFATKGVIWLLGSDGLTKHGLRFVRHSRRFIEMFLEYYPVLENYVHDLNKESIAWLKMCGAKIEEPKPYGLEQENFRYFRFERNK